MERMESNQSLRVNEQLVSSNGRVRLLVQHDGNVVLSRSDTGQALWASNTVWAGVSELMMQSDGNLVASTANGAVVWESATAGHWSASVMLKDDGNMVVQDGQGAELWSAHTNQEFRPDTWPVIEYSDAMGYTCTETSDWLKAVASYLPCAGFMHWPDYDTKVVVDRIDGKDVIIQLWKGWCQRMLGLKKFPGGMGAEVGVYHLVPGRLRPTSPPFLPPGIEKFMLRSAPPLDEILWWPFTELRTEIEFELINPITETTFISADPEESYWLNKWMQPESYRRYQRDQGRSSELLPHWFPGNGRYPRYATGYVLEYRINGKAYPRW